MVATAALALAATVVFGASRPGSVSGCPTGCAASAERAPGPPRILVLNVFHGFPRFAHLPARLDHIAAEIRRLDPDIVLLQEVPWTRRLGDGGTYLSAATGLNHLSVRDNGNRHLLGFETGLAILSRYSLSDAEAVELSPRAGFFENRLALRAGADTPWGPVQVVVTHLTHGNRETNRRQSERLSEWVEGIPHGPIVVGGDFNAVPESPQIRALSAKWTDTYRSANGTDGGLTCCTEASPHSSDQGRSARIDYLFVVPSSPTPAAVLSSRLVLSRPFRWRDEWIWPSDHAGVLTEIDWSAGTPGAA